MKLDVLAIAAHPDDTELCCAGTLARLAAQGLRCGVLDLTRGEMGTRGTPELRHKEAEDAARILGLTSRMNLSLPDNGLINSREHQDEIIRAVRSFQPEICMINAPEDRHPDHGHAHKLTLDALFYSGLRKRETSAKDGSPQQPWRPSHILFYMQDTPFEPDLIFDISETQDIKEQAILAFKSQFNAPENDNEPGTYISGKNFIKMLRSRARVYGHRIGVAFGEPFQYYGGPLPFDDFSFFMKHRPLR
jgi:bacillithiol biosynthesis deacetylase BshB1